MKFSANLGFLWNNLPLPEAIKAAKEAGFDAVECHWPYDYPAEIIKNALDETGLTMLGLNTRRGNVEAGENGLSAIVGREKEAFAAVDEAIKYAETIGTKNIHVMAGFASGEEAHKTFLNSLNYACENAKPHGITILIEPLNKYDAPRYFLTTTSQAVQIIKELDRPNLKLMFDCYHVQLMEGNLTNRIQDLKNHIGHIQFASVPDRGSPDHGEINYNHIFKIINDMGYEDPIGAEYKTLGETFDTLSWLKKYHEVGAV